MPTRSLTSSVFKWPEPQTVLGAFRRWAANLTQSHPEVMAVGYFGSYARGDWGVGSDLDVIIILTDSDKPFEFRSAAWDTRSIPVPTDVLVYSQDEWRSLVQTRPSWNGIARETVWVYGAPPAP